MSVSSDSGLPSIDEVFGELTEDCLTFKKYLNLSKIIKKNKNKNSIYKSSEIVEKLIIKENPKFSDLPNELDRPMDRDPHAFFGGLNRSHPLRMPGESVKEKTKAKRLKGQSGEEHMGRTWKPESMIRLRQEFD